MGSAVHVHVSKRRGQKQEKHGGGLGNRGVANHEERRTNGVVGGSGRGKNGRKSAMSSKNGGRHVPATKNEKISELKVSGECGVPWKKQLPFL